ncbi:sensor histidine kinase [Terracoccus luteus]|uniref:histidine kinase n=2 Tax=Terracoccus luteus TaxID=53356 RepID=A0A495Y1X1_9MICO|nr:ATP-binding protein [Terracoccus luteus]MBB2986636.1 sensor histidine kinase regulating citrate/malate metabolism [Terracoccus luteus]MCP2171775.1 sensor histidine kinase regulating citrate/malate metabolism [Terracoccus luteus]RKT79385.1 sensor histidine kinase regulating citrate/malate metabolism [Terracoccus luteus]
MQLLIVSVVLVGVAAVSIAQSNARFRDSEGRRAQQIAEVLSQTPGIRDVVEDGGQFAPQANFAAEAARAFSDSAQVLIAGVDRKVVASTGTGPAVAFLQDTEAFDGRGWVGEQQGTGEAMAMAPVISSGENDPERTDPTQPDAGETVGVVAVVRTYPSVWDNLAQAMPNLLTYMGIASLLGVVGSLLLARRVKQQTLGLEPREITGLVEQREAVLHGIKEGLLAVDLTGRVTQVNDEAATLLGIPQMDSEGRMLRDLDPTGRLSALFDHPEPVVDRVMSFGTHAVAVNLRPVRTHGRLIGHVATLRDRTELLELQRELDLTRSTTDSLRTQAHEFSNRMHVVSGLIELGEYDDVRSYIQRISADEEQLTARVTSLVADPAVAAMLLAKSRQADERGAELVVDESTHLGRLDGDVSTDVNTVLGNLVDNALDAAGVGTGRDGIRARVTVTIVKEDGVVRITVRDNGPGVDLREGDVFARGYSTKPGGAEGRRGIGLALVRIVCRKRGGEVTVHNDDGAVFTATVPEVPLTADSPTGQGVRSR